MKLLVFSDSHHRVEPMVRAVVREHPDQILHLGDLVRDADELAERFPQIPLLRVKGNCDLDPIAREKVLTEWDGVRFFLTHGHCYGVKSGLLRLSLAAREAQADVVLFGHTHTPLCRRENGVWYLNPGSCGGAFPSYGVVELSGGQADCRLANFEDLEEFS